MEPRLNAFAAAPALMKQFFEFSDEVAGQLEHSLIELVKIRASQINGCANCLNMHTSDARKAGETEQRLHCSRPGMKRRFSPPVSGPHWPGSII